MRVPALPVVGLGESLYLFAKLRLSKLAQCVDDVDVIEIALELVMKTGPVALMSIGEH